MKILILDNYDSFTYNLVKIIRDVGFGNALSVFRNDEIDIQEAKYFQKILISPGPGMPEDAGITKELIKAFAHEKDILGVCLGHQGIAEVFGAKLFNLEDVLHGVSNRTTIIDPQEKLFRNLPNEFTAGHYHSWSVRPESINGELQVTAVDEKGLIMAIRHKEFAVRGVQFHPESVLTENGDQIIKNWIEN